jgi:putative FmdB family regulatory protein
MPIYEFYCKKCHTVFNFFSRRIDTEKIPLCPACKTTPLQRQMSVFAKISGDKAESSEGDDRLPLDEAKMEKAMTMLAEEVGSLDENDPRQAAVLMRKFSEATGMNMGDAMEEVLSRMEAGEDPDEIEAQMGDLLEEADPFNPGKKKKRPRRAGKPRVDETLYDL